eukprot:1482670-Amphidinium_carterae.1
MPGNKRMHCVPIPILVPLSRNTRGPCVFLDACSTWNLSLSHPNWVNPPLVLRNRPQSVTVHLVHGGFGAIVMRLLTMGDCAFLFAHVQLKQVSCKPYRAKASGAPLRWMLAMLQTFV